MFPKNKQRVERLLAKLDAGKSVSMRSLHTALGDTGVNEYEKLWADEQDKRSMFADKPNCIKQYEAMLKRADFASLRADKMTVGKRSVVDSSGRNSKLRLRVLSERLYEQALERLQEMITEDKSLQIWFDRDTDWTIAGDTGIDCASVPRVVTSKSIYNKRALVQCSKNDIKRDVLMQALEGDAGQLTKQQNDLLRGRMAKMREFLDSKD